MDPKMITISSVSLRGREREYVNDCLDRGQLSWHGEYVTRFEEAFARFCNVKHAVAVMNGTAAMHLALRAAGVRPGDDVYLPALTYIATANAVRYCGATPVFCDVDLYTWCLDPHDVRRKIADRRAATTHRGTILPVHLYGVPAAMQELRAIATTYGFNLIEDAAEAHGATLGSARAGALGDAAAFSFFANKIMTTGEGGMVTTDDDGIAHIARHLRGQSQTERRFYHDSVGFNYRMTNIQAAIGLAQLEVFGDLAAMRQAVSDRYRRGLPDFITQRIPRDTIGADWLYSVLVPTGISRDLVIIRLREAGIETRPVFVPLTDMPPYYATTAPNTRLIAHRGISLPTHPELTADDVDRVIDEFTKACR
jgi:perosamine synthetase